MKGQKQCFRSVDTLYKNKTHQREPKMQKLQPTNVIGSADANIK